MDKSGIIMKSLIAIVLLAICGTATGQGKPASPKAADSFYVRQAHYMKACNELIGPWQQAIEAFNAAHKDEGVVANLGCMWQPPQATKRPVKTYPITPDEAVHLNILRHDSDAAYSNQDAYQNYLYIAHGIRNPEVGEPCWHFVGFILDEDYITDDPNTGFDSSDCAPPVAPPEPVKPMPFSPADFCDRFPNHSCVAPATENPSWDLTHPTPDCLNVSHPDAKVVGD